MDNFVPKEISDSLDAARIAALKKTSRLRVEVGTESYRVLRMWRGGFAVEAAATPRLRGLVDIYDGGKHLCQCLIVAAEEEGGEMRYDFKRSTASAESAALDFERAADAPVAYLPLE
ncbi:hypothetical protein ACFORG_08980 [Lutimaribacter marinistellae]|uniref:Uncharacterized protein n=1 Tax=Lutimaribacter marinistellae TaxID=1820329 RepID=A0ABV7THK2_9RHOB